ncbi:DUF2691 family protein [Bacillus infantis]|uniref:DUF2691 family protein n=1 Tax=Bacillus infantis TaxID=324767 RepID=UPI003AFAD50D
MIAKIAILIVDSSYTAVYCKDRERTERLYRFCRERFRDILRMKMIEMSLLFGD